ncbi:quinolinate synthase NadA [Candidatus Symbiobacter mobilis]|nr:quinolinate synthase NadA [Candidatus Symbiobacter mobilis]
MSTANPIDNPARSPATPASTAPFTAPFREFSFDLPQPLPGGELRCTACSTRVRIPEPTPDGAARAQLRARARELLASRSAVLMAHYYVDADVQDLAIETQGFVGDSLELARYGQEHPARNLVVCGVRFMGETAKILSPDKEVWMPDPHADCSLDMGCPPETFSRFCDAHPNRTVVVYANTSAAVKARADWVVTSSCAVHVVRHLADQGHKILWAPDCHLGSYVQRQTGADMLVWGGSCIVHREFDAASVRSLLQRREGARLLAHPESPADVLEQADMVGSTTAILRAPATLDAALYVVATDGGLLHRLRQAYPGKEFVGAPTLGVHGGRCPWMSANGLASLVRVLESRASAIEVDPGLAERARIPIERMLAFTRPAP